MNLNQSQKTVKLKTVRLGNKNNRNKKQEMTYLYLKYLDIDRSSIILAEVCHEIDLALRNVKINYLWWEKQ